MSATTLGLDIGGANVKAATPGGRATSIAFPLWKQPHQMLGVLAQLLATFPDTATLAVTMTGELCDCFRTKRDGVNVILDAVEAVATGRTVRVWGTDGTWRTPAAARPEWLRVAAANWHALATFAVRHIPSGPGLLIDIGSTTADFVPLNHRRPVPRGHTDPERLRHRELVYTGVRRTPVCAVLPPGRVMAEFFATTLDAWLMFGHISPDESDTDTADGRPATPAFARERLARMLGGDDATLPAHALRELAAEIIDTQESLLLQALAEQLKHHPRPFIITSGSGEFLARRILNRHPEGTFAGHLSLTEHFGPAVAACAPAFALAHLAAGATA